MTADSDDRTTPPVARSEWECQTYLALFPCPDCGTVGQEPIESLVGQGADPMIRTYQTECPGCGTRRRFTFRQPGANPPFPAFGVDRPSELIDAGQFLRLAEELAEAVPADPAELLATGPAGPAGTEPGSAGPAGTEPGSAGPAGTEPGSGREGAPGLGDAEAPDPREALEDLAIAIAAVEEVLRFVPANATAVPRAALWTPASLTRYDDQPEAFERRHLVALLGGLRRVHSAYATAIG